MRDIMTMANKKNLPMLEIPRSELDRLTDGAVHQGIAMQIPPYQYPDATDLVLDAMQRWHAANLSRLRFSWLWMVLPILEIWAQLFVAFRLLAVMELSSPSVALLR